MSSGAGETLQITGPRAESQKAFVLPALRLLLLSDVHKASEVGRP